MSFFPPSFRCFCVTFCLTCCLLTTITPAHLFGQENDSQEDNGQENGQENDSAKKPKQEFYELRIYKIYDFEKQQRVENYLKHALLPALNRLEIDRVGVFTNQGDVNDHSVFVLIPFSKIEHFTQLNQSLASDDAYQDQASTYFEREKKNAAYDRIESRFMKAFSGMPVMEIPKFSKDKQERIFELRLYQSHTEDHARRKVHMFNDGEIQIMRDSEMAPVFYGETLIGPDVPNLIYMLSSPDMESHKKHWQKFLAHPEWNRIKKLEQYKDTVSKIQSWTLQPTHFSQL